MSSRRPIGRTCPPIYSSLKRRSAGCASIASIPRTTRDSLASLWTRCVRTKPSCSARMERQFVSVRRAGIGSADRDGLSFLKMSRTSWTDSSRSRSRSRRSGDSGDSWLTGASVHPTPCRPLDGNCLSSTWLDGSVSKYRTTFVTTDPAGVAAFRTAGRTVLKAVQDARVSTDAEERYGFARELPNDAPVAGAVAAPVLLQRLVSKVADVRVTVVGSRVFPVRITTPADGPIDFREAGSDSSSFEVASLPLSASTACVRFIEAYGLRFGAFDFAEDVDGSLWFLECNPNGQWAWLERRTGLPITAALMDLLLAPLQ